MSTGAKIGLGIGLLSVLALMVYKAGKTVVEGISYRILGFDTPKIAKQVITLPTKVEFSNASPVPIPIQSLFIDLSYRRNNEWVKAGKIAQQNITIEPGKKVITFNPQVDLKSLFSNILQTADTVLNSGRLDIKADVTVTVTGIPVTETVYHQIPLTW